MKVKSLVFKIVKPGTHDRTIQFNSGRNGTPMDPELMVMLVKLRRLCLLLLILFISEFVFIHRK